jgi:hypothetical protein
MTKLLRVGQIYGRGGPIPVGKTQFYENIVYRKGGPENIPGTDIPRLRLTSLSERVRVGFEDEVHAIAEALRARRDAAIA